MSLGCLYQSNVKKSKKLQIFGNLFPVLLESPKYNPGKLMKIVSVDKEFLHIFWMSWGNSIKFSGKMCFDIILKVTKNQGFLHCADKFQFCCLHLNYLGGHK